MLPWVEKEVADAGFTRRADRPCCAAMSGGWCNGRWLEDGENPLLSTDRGLLHGLGLFETMLASDGCAPFLAEHLLRLQDSCRRLGWQPALPDCTELAAIIAQLLESRQLACGRARLRLALSGGSGPLDDLRAGDDSTVWLTAGRLSGGSDRLAVNFCPWTRNERSPLAGLKCASYAENLIALDHARRLGFGETLIADTMGRLCEAATANVFWVQDGRLHSPPLDTGCLPGVTRATLFRLAGESGICCRETHLPIREILGADEVFLSSSTRGVAGVSRIESRDFPAGEITRRLGDAWQREVLQRSRTLRHDLH
jgi:branched-subunit amino acid aminotransferase/4-amino-4-deoxychorismate lyase